MPRQDRGHGWRGWGLVVSAWLLSSSAFMLVGCAARGQSLAASGWHVQVPAASQVRRLHPLPLTVRLSDAAGQPVDGVPVRFRPLPPWTAAAEVVPDTVVTRHGQATATFRATAAGRVPVEITIANLRKVIDITVLDDTPRF
ncbi:MAG: hypothetical protein KatS3mg131_0495 [Candidatus Tectimicrobiota bacterium]|nr:MAG: hypothetical protein KatS3mg131_0495 [Candidatus Tectomicrobia bacterium]